MGDIPDHKKLQSPANHSLPELFRALKYGRPAEEQKFLLELAESIDDRGYNGFNGHGQDDDPADWWKPNEGDQGK